MIMELKYQLRFNFDQRSTSGRKFETLEAAEKEANEMMATSGRLRSVDIFVIQPILIRTITEA